MAKGTIGELLVQTRLLQYGVQAAPPLKDSGNDLIALKGDAIKTIQVKTCTNRFDTPLDLPEKYHRTYLSRLPHGQSNRGLARRDRSPGTIGKGI